MIRSTTFRTGSATLLSVLLAVSFAGAPAAAAERPDDWTCDASGMVCAGANAGASVDCSWIQAGEATCSWTYGQMMGGASPIGLPGEASFTYGATIEVCLTTAGGDPIDCVSETTTGQDGCMWLPATECVVSLGPNPGTSGTWSVATGECLETTVTVWAHAEATTVSGDLALAQAVHDAAGSNAESLCLQNNGR